MNKAFSGVVMMCLFISLGFVSTGQSTIKTTPNGWHLLDREENSVLGISLDKTYELVKNKKSQKVLVAVIDGGIDTLHEDLKEILWKNPKEIPGNGIDDDKNGYKDDIYGWNFIGGSDGQNVYSESLERDRIYHNYKTKYEDKEIKESELSKEELESYRLWKKAKEELFKEDEGGEAINILFLKMAYQNMSKMDSLLQNAIGKKEYTGNDLDKFNPDQDKIKKAKEAFLEMMKGNNMMDLSNKEFMDGFKEFVDQEQKKADAKEKAPVPHRQNIVKDNYSDFNDRYYGNNDVYAGNNKSSFHGTHVAGIIGAGRKNGKGIDGIADNVKIMMVRVVPDGDEYDKDVALAIRYAVDNGAQVINMSFGKYFSPEKKWVDEAVKYAAEKGVLLVSAAGNEAFNGDSLIHYPSNISDKGNVYKHWISVGASSNLSVDTQSKDSSMFYDLPASFSNYGKKTVDVFAPGVKIYSAAPESKYVNADGTSMASPVVAGIAALILEYYPSLSAEQVKYCIEKSVVPPTDKVMIPGTGKKADLAEICRTGGIVNAYNAMKIAATLKGERKPGNQLKPF
jgi:subtilisin family serine protease